jgi:hypothetical protein
LILETLLLVTLPAEPLEATRKELGSGELNFVHSPPQGLCKKKRGGKGGYYLKEKLREGSEQVCVGLV